MKSAERKVIDAIVDQELDTAEVIDNVAGRLDVSKEKLRFAVRNIARLVRSGQLTRREARKKFGQVFTMLALYEYCHDVLKVQRIVDEHLVKQVKAIAELDKPLREVQVIREEDMKVRALERAEGRREDAS